MYVRVSVSMCVHERENDVKSMALSAAQTPDYKLQTCSTKTRSVVQKKIERDARLKSAMCGFAIPMCSPVSGNATNWLVEGCST